MTKKDDSPKAGEDPYWSKELLAVLVVALGDEDQAREALEGSARRARYLIVGQPLSWRQILR